MAKSKAKVAAELEAKKNEGFPKFPRTLYKKGGELVWTRKEFTYSIVNVENEEEMSAALKAGYSDSFDNLFTKAVEIAEEKKIEEDDF